MMVLEAKMLFSSVTTAFVQSCLEWEKTYNALGDNADTPMPL